jgi:hypothetical protein
MTADSGPGERTESVAFWAAVTAVGVFVVWLIADIGSVSGALYRNPGNASSLVLAQYLGDHRSGDVVLGNYAWLEPL